MGGRKFLSLFSFLFMKKRELPELMHRKTITSMQELKNNIKPPFVFVVFDTETNGFTKRQGVLSIAALKYYYDGVTFTHIGTYERFYFPKGKLNKEAVAVNGLTRKVIRKMRKGFHYPRHWYKDTKSFREFIGSDTDLLVGHNITFDARFFWFMEPMKKFCTMWASAKKVGSLNKNGKTKQPKLVDTAIAYGIQINEEKLHESSYDTELTYNIFQKIVEENFIEKVVF